MKQKISIKKNIERLFDDENDDERNVYQIMNVHSNFLNDMNAFFAIDNINVNDFFLHEFMSKKRIDNLNDDNFFLHEFKSKKN